MSQWAFLSFEQAVQWRGSGASALPQSDWLAEGRFPVIGQGAEFVEGWTNREDLVLTPAPAVVLYGGHTRRAKYVDRPFVPGPNVKILEPGERLDARFLHRFLEQLHIENRGYADHFPEVRRVPVPVPSLVEQRRVADVLDKADAIRRKRKEAIGLTEEFLRSAFLEMFGDPVTNPKGWPVGSLGSLCSLVRGSSPRPQGDPRYFGGPVPRLMVADMTRDGLFVKAEIDSLTEAGALLSRPVKNGTVVMAVSGNVGVAALLAQDACIHDGFVGFCGLDHTRLLPEYLLVLLRTLRPTWQREQAGAIFQNVTTTDVKERFVPLPPLTLQVRFTHILKKWLGSRALVTAARDLADSLVNSISARAFSNARELSK